MVQLRTGYQGPSGPHQDEAWVPCVLGIKLGALHRFSMYSCPELPPGLCRWLNPDLDLRAWWKHSELLHM